MRYLSRVFVVFFIALLLVGCESKDFLSSEPTESSDLAADGIGLAKSKSADDCACGTVEARLSSSGEINPPLLTASGNMRGDLRGVVNYEAYLDDIVPINSGFGNDPTRASASFVGTWTLTTRNGVLTFRDVGVFEQEPSGLGSSFSRVIDGTGCYKGASGYLFLSFISDETGLNFKEELKGVIFCAKHLPKDKNNNDS